MYCDFFKCTVNLNFKRKWKKDRFFTKCTANVNFQRFLKTLLRMILDAINRISFGNCRRSKEFQVNYGKPDFFSISSQSWNLLYILRWSFHQKISTAYSRTHNFTVSNHFEFKVNIKIVKMFQNNSSRFC